MVFPYPFFSEMLASVYDTLIDASFYLLFGLIAAGMIKAWVNEKRMVRSLGPSTFGLVFKASLIGIPLPLCSCSVVPLALSVREKGASRGATVSFLISTPETGVDSVAVTYALLDPLMTIFRPVSAMITALTAGLAENLFGKTGNSKNEDTSSSLNKISVIRTAIQTTSAGCMCPDSANCSEPGTTITSFHLKLKDGIRYAFIDLLGDIAVYLLIGLFLSGLISVFIPADWFTDQPEWLVMLMMLAIGIPLYVCASASTPVVAALILKGVSPGAALIFLLAGPATNIATLSIVGRTLGTRSALLYVLTIMVTALVMGIFLNGIYSGFSITPSAMIGAGADIMPEWIKTGSAVLMFALILYHSFLKIRKKFK